MMLLHSPLEHQDEIGALATQLAPGEIRHRLDCSARSIARPDTPKTSLIMLASLMLAVSRSFSSRLGVVTPSWACGPTRGRITEWMMKISYSGYRFPPEIIHQAIWLYLRFTLSLRDVEDLLAERGVAVSYETVRRWVNHFGPMIAADLRKRRLKPHTTWHLDEVYLKIDGRKVYLWRAVDAEGEVLDVLVQSKRNKHAALKLMRKLLKKYASVPERLVTDDLRSYSAAARDLGIEGRHERGRWSTVHDWRGGCRSRGVAVRRQLSHIAGASIRTVAPFPVAARQ